MFKLSVQTSSSSDTSKIMAVFTEYFQPPENALQKNQEREVSEHELRIQVRSFSKATYILNILQRSLHIHKMGYEIPIDDILFFSDHYKDSMCLIGIRTMQHRLPRVKRQTENLEVELD